jgi:hypothetical protein
VPAQQITNPSGAYSGVTDFTTGRDSLGADLDYGCLAFPLVASATIVKGEAVALIAPTTTQPPRVRPFVGGTDAYALLIGVAQDSAAAGEVCQVVTYGFVLAQGDGSATAGSLLDVDASSHVTTEAVDATDVVGTILGRALTDDSTVGLLFPIWVMRM